MSAGTKTKSCTVVDDILRLLFAPEHIPGFYQLQLEVAKSADGVTIPKERRCYQHQLLEAISGPVVDNVTADSIRLMFGEFCQQVTRMTVVRTDASKESNNRHAGGGSSSSSSTAKPTPTAAGKGAGSGSIFSGEVDLSQLGAGMVMLRVSPLEEPVNITTLNPKFGFLGQLHGCLVRR